MSDFTGGGMPEGEASFCQEADARAKMLVYLLEKKHYTRRYLINSETVHPHGYLSIRAYVLNHKCILTWLKPLDWLKLNLAVNYASDVNMNSKYTAWGIRFASDHVNMSII